jgi:hypothetical protein
MGWDCPRCAAENPLTATRCLSCGYQYFPGSDQAPPAGGHLHDSVLKEREAIREDIKKGLDEANHRTRAALDRLAGPSKGDRDS